jgi:hypothetical protein
MSEVNDIDYKIDDSNEILLKFLNSINRYIPHITSEMIYPGII